MRELSAIVALAVCLAAPAFARDDADAGAALFQRLECGGCHVTAARPGMVVRPLESLSARYDEASLAAYLAAPPDPMPAVALPETERRILSAWLLSRYP